MTRGRWTCKYDNCTYFMLTPTRLKFLLLNLPVTQYISYSHSIYSFFHNLHLQWSFSTSYTFSLTLTVIFIPRQVHFIKVACHLLTLMGNKIIFFLHLCQSSLVSLVLLISQNSPAPNLSKNHTRRPGSK